MESGPTKCIEAGNYPKSFHKPWAHQESNTDSVIPVVDLDNCSDPMHLHPDFAHLSIWSYDEFLFEQLGEGFYGTVYKATHLPSGEVLVLKELKCEEYRNLFTEEIRMLCRLLHPNVLKCRGLSLHNGNMCYLAEYISGGSLADMLSKHDPCVTTWMSCLTIAMDIARGMAYVHSQGVIHRDLNSNNILVRYTADGRTESIIADLGLSCDLPDLAQDSSLVPHGPVGSPFHIAPELFRLEPSSKEADVFSFGIILCEMIAQAPGADPDELPRTSDFGVDVKELSELAADCPAEVLNLAVRCCQIDPSLRPTFADIVKIIDIILDHLQEQDSLDDTLSDCDAGAGELDYVIEQSVVCKCSTNRDRAPSVSSLDVHLTKNRLGSLDRTSSRRTLRKRLRRCSLCGGRIIALSGEYRITPAIRLSAPLFAFAAADEDDECPLARLSEVPEDHGECGGVASLTHSEHDVSETVGSLADSSGGDSYSSSCASPASSEFSPGHSTSAMEDTSADEIPQGGPALFEDSVGQVKGNDSLKRHAHMPASLILMRDHKEIHSKTTRLVQSTPGRLPRFFHTVMGRRRSRIKVSDSDERKSVMQGSTLRKKLSLVLNLDSVNENVRLKSKRNASLTPTDGSRSEFFVDNASDRVDGSADILTSDNDLCRNAVRNSSAPCVFCVAARPGSTSTSLEADGSADAFREECQHSLPETSAAIRAARKKRSFSFMKYVRKKVSGSGTL